MGIFNSFGALSGQFAAKQERTQIAAALVKELQTPGMLQTLLDVLHKNGFGALTRQPLTTQPSTLTPAEVQQALADTNLIDDLARSTSMPVGVVKSGLATLLPLTLRHLTQTGNITPEGQASASGLIEQGSLSEALR